MDAPPQIDTVEVDGLVALKVINHCVANLPNLVTGQLVGLDFGNVVEVTNCFPFLSTASNENDGDAYQETMLRRFRDMNVDSNMVGWYQSTYLRSFLNEVTIETQFTYQQQIGSSVMLVFDPLQTQSSNLAIKAYRLTNTFMNMRRSNVSFTRESLSSANLKSSDVFEELCVTIHNTHLADALLNELGQSNEASLCADVLKANTTPLVEQNIERLLECVDDHNMELNKLQYFQRNVQRQKAQQQQYLNKMRAEMAQQREAGFVMKEPDVSNNPLFQPIPEPQRLPLLLLQKQIDDYCREINNTAGGELSRLFLANGLQREEEGR